MKSRVLIACVGNVLKGDDGFGVAVANRLAKELPPRTDVIETGIGGVSIVQLLMQGYDALIVVDAVDRGVATGTVLVLQRQVADSSEVSNDEWRREYSNWHLAE